MPIGKFRSFADLRQHLRRAAKSKDRKIRDIDAYTAATARAMQGHPGEGQVDEPRKRRPGEEG